MKTYHIIFNPLAGKKKSLKNLQKVEEIFTARGVSYQTHVTQAIGDSKRITQELTAAGERDIVVMGGDGTLHQVLNGITDIENCRLGIIPSGTGNDFATHANIPLDVEKAVAILLDSEAKPIDILEVSGVRCINVGGLGMDVDVLERCKAGKRKGKWKYVKSLLKSLFAFKGYKVEIISGKRRETHDALLAAACNGSQFGGGVRICPAADSSDGKINAMVVESPGGKWKIIKAFFSLMKGKILEKPITTHFLCEELKILPVTPCTVQLDGELYKGLDFHVKIVKGLHCYRG